MTRLIQILKLYIESMHWRYLLKLVYPAQRQDFNFQIFMVYYFDREFPKQTICIDFKKKLIFNKKETSTFATTQRTHVHITFQHSNIQEWIINVNVMSCNMISRVVMEINGPICVMCVWLVSLYSILFSKWNLILKLTEANAIQPNTTQPKQTQFNSIQAL